jgi:DNA-directed RNA polymerase beta' subunit
MLFRLRLQEKISTLEINAPGQVTCSDLGLPNSSYACTTCGSNDRKSCDGVYEHIVWKIGLEICGLIYEIYYALID